MLAPPRLALLVRDGCLHGYSMIGAFSYVALACLLSGHASAATLRVGSQRDIKLPSVAANVARDGDLVEIDAGIYAADAVVWRQSRLTIRGMGGRAHIRADGAQAEGKALW